VRAGVGGVEIEHFPTGVLFMTDVTVDITGVGVNMYAELAGRIHDEIESVKRTLDAYVEGVAVRVRLSGEGPMHIIRIDPHIREEGCDFLEYVSKGFGDPDGDSKPHVWIREIDATECRPPRDEFDLDALRKENSLEGELVRLVDSIKKDRSKSGGLSSKLLFQQISGSSYKQDTALKRLFESRDNFNKIEIPGDELLDAALLLCLESLRRET